MWRGAFEIETVAGTKTVVALVLEPDFEFAPQHVQKLFAFVGISFAASSSRLDAEQMRFHRGVAPGEELHAHLGAGFEDFAFGRANQGTGVAIGIKQRGDIGLIESSDAAERCDRAAHLTALEGTEKTHGDIRRACHLHQGETTLRAHPAKTLPRRLPSINRCYGVTLLFQDVNNRSGIKTASAAKENCTLQQPDVEFGVQAITALGALRRHQSENLPGTERGGRDTQTLRNFGNA